MKGKRLLHYQIGRALGSGGMGELYSADDLKLNRPVTIKMLPPGSELDSERFQKQATALRALSHPNIVTPYGLEQGHLEQTEDEIDGGDRAYRFLVMEPIDGTSLRYNIPELGIVSERLMDLAVSLADAVATAHSADLYHLDLNPDNVLIDHEGRANILNFGLEEPHEYQTTSDLRHRDIRSLGTMLYQMATGRHPSPVNRETAGRTTLVRDKTLPIAQRRPDLPPGLISIIDHSLSLDPDLRYSDADEIAKDLRRVKSGLKPATAEVSQPDASDLSIPRRRLFLSLSGVGLVVAVLFGIFQFGQFGTPSEESEPERLLIAVLPFENLGPAEDAYFALGMTEEIITRLSSVRRLGVIARSSTERFAGSGKDSAEIGNQLGADFVLEGSVRWNPTQTGDRRARVTPRLIRTSDSAQLWSTGYERVLEDIFSVQNEIAVQVIEALNITLFPSERQALETRPTQNMEAYQIYLRALEEADRIDNLESQLQAIELLEQAVSLDPEFVEGWARLAWTHAQIFHFGLDRTDSRRRGAEDTIQHALSLDPTSPEARLAKANVLYWTQKDYRGALRELALARRRAPNDSRMIQAEGFILRRLGHLEDALKKLLESSELDPVNSVLKREVATTLFYLRRYEEALPFYDQAITLTDAPTQAYLYKARTLSSMGRMSSARKVLDTMPASDLPLSSWIQIWQAIYEKDYPRALERIRGSNTDFFQWRTSALPFSLLEAQVLRLDGREAEARERYLAALNDIEMRLTHQNNDPRLLASRGLAMAGLGRKEEALRYGRLATELLPLEVDLIDGGDYRLQLADILTLVGELDAAIDELELLLSIPSSVSVPGLRIDPRWDPLRNHPRFKALTVEADRRHPR